MAELRGPCLSMYIPTSGATKAGIRKGRKMKLEPKDVQPNSLFTRSGRVASHTDMSTDWARVQIRADQRRQDDRRTRTGGRGLFEGDGDPFAWGVWASPSGSVV